jgi:hypothetical protein
MCHTAIVEQIGDLCKIQFIVQQEFFDPFNFVIDDELLNGNALDFRKNIGQVGIVVV